jgi:signal transduction histidine kinase
MKRVRYSPRRTAEVFLAILLPAMVAFWYLLGGFFSNLVMSNADRARSAVMNQADRLAFDLDLELSLLDSYLSRTGDNAGPSPGDISDYSQAVREAMEAYRSSARWPDLVSGLYLVEPSEGGAAVSATLLLNGAEGTEPNLELIEALYANAFRAADSGKAREHNAEKLLTRYAPLSDGDGNTAHDALIIAVLEDTVLVDTILPALVSRYFGADSGFEGYSVGVRDASGAKRFGTGPLPGQETDFQRPLFRDPYRFDLAGFYSTFAPRESEGETSAFLSIPALPGGNARVASRSLREYVEQRYRLEADGPFMIDRYRFHSTNLHGAWMLEISGKRRSIASDAYRQSRDWSMSSAGFLAFLYGGIVLLFMTARRADRLAARERDFVASVTHELKTPIAVALSAGENLAKGIVPADRVAAYGATVAQEARRLAYSVERLLLLAGLESAQSIVRPEPISVAGIIPAIVARLSPLADTKGASFELAIAETLPSVEASCVLLESAIDGVVNNAIKYAGGTIRIAAKAERRKNRGVVVVTVSDGGPGVPRPERHKLFEPFYRGSQAIQSGVQGTGIGLYLARRIARLYGGDARARFPADGGTTIELYFRSMQ